MTLSEAVQQLIDQLGGGSGTFPEKPQVSEGSTVCNHRSCSDWAMTSSCMG